MSNIVIDSLEKYKKFISSNNEEKINILRVKSVYKNWK